MHFSKILFPLERSRILSAKFLSAKLYKSEEHSVKKILTLCLTAALCTGALAAPDPNFHIYIAFGQSNMEGQADVIEENKVKNDRFVVLASMTCSNMGRTLGEWSVAVPPLFHCYTGLSPADYFGKTMVEKLPNVKVGVIPVAVAGSSIKLFDKAQYSSYLSTTESWLQNKAADYGSNPYGRIIDLATEAQKVGVIKGILMHQGETDAYSDTWATTVKKVYEDMLSDLKLSADSVPLIVGEVLQGGQCASANSQIDALPNKIPTAHVVSSKDCSGGSDNLHFDNAGYQLLGKRYAETMLALLKTTETSGGESSGESGGESSDVKASSTPYNGRISIPGKLEAENYDLGGQNVAYYDKNTDDAPANLYREDNAGVDTAGSAYFYGWTQADEWILFSVDVKNAGAYNFTANVASGSDGGAFSLELDGSEIASVSVPNTGSFSTFTTVTGKTSALSQGEHLLKLLVKSPYFNVDWIEFTAEGTEKISNVRFEKNGTSSYSIYDINGKRIGTAVFRNKSESESLRVLREKYPEGMYRYKRSVR